MELLKRGAAKLGIYLTACQLEQFQSYYGELSEWNKRINLTSITGCEEVQVKHFLDSLTPVLAFAPGAIGAALGSMIDVGAGAGFPGVALKIAFPTLQLALVESTRKKARFLVTLAAKLGLTGVDVIDRRAEDVARDARYRERFPLVAARAVSALPALVELTLPFCSVGGSLVALKKGDIGEEVSSSSRIIRETGGRLRGLVEVGLDEFPDGRCLVVIDKVAPTPERYPRPAGIPARKPVLG